MNLGNAAKDKWYTEFVDFHNKKQTIERFLKDKSRRGSAIEDDLKEDSIWISNNEKEIGKSNF